MRKIKSKVKQRIKPKDLQIQDIKIRPGFIIITIAIVLFILFILGGLIDIPEIEEKGEEEETINGEIEIQESFFSSDDLIKVKMYLPAVNPDGKGVNTVLTVEATPGNGRTLTDIDNLLFWADTQHSIRIARRVAENITGKKMKDYDLVYTIEANASIIGGPSAGAALTLATIAALEKKKLNESVMITGTVNHDGSIGPVSTILEKAKAAKDIGAEIFLVPLLQSRDIVYEIREHCEVFGHTKICTSETIPKKINVREEAGIEIIEIASVQEAAEYFFE